MSDDGTTHRREPTSIRAPEPALLLYHRDGTKVVPLPRGKAIAIGRTWPADAVVDDRSLSRKHATVTMADDGVTIEDLGSTNGTWVNGVRLGANKVARIAPGDVLRLGDVTCALHAVSTQRLEGAVSYERFRALLEEETQRAHAFKRTVALLMIKAKPTNDGAALDAFVPSLMSALRPVDRIGAYADDTVLVLLPEMSAADATAFAARFAAESSTLVGGAVYPDDGAGAEELLDAARKSLTSGRANASLPPRASGAVVVESAKMRAVMAEIARVAASVLPVLVIGETGAGKELVARSVHEQSPRAQKPFRSVNCGAIPQSLVEGTLFGHERGAFTSADRTTKGLFEQAHGGTLFLDEIGELPPSAQAALLRVLETKKLTRVGGDREIDADVRIVAATHRDLEAMANEGAFRKDLLYRLNAVVVTLPPLRERLDELDSLVRTFIAQANDASGRRIAGVDPDARAILRSHAWPGNVRELKNVIERAVVIARGDRISADDFPERMRASSPSIANEPSIPRAMTSPPQAMLAGGVDFKERVKEQMRTYETELIVSALAQSNGNQTEAAKLLGMPVRTLAHKIKELGIKKGFST